jgi:hypothetical protein
MSKSILAAAAVATFAGAAFAQQNQLTFSYSDLSASFDNSSRVFNAVAVAPVLGFQTGGDVSRIDTSPSQTASFATGFRGASTADINVLMNIGTTFQTDLLGRNTVAGTGNFTITDIDADTITGTIAGIWTDLGNGFDSFQGLITAASLNPLGAGDNLDFNGLAGQFAYAGLPTSGLTGALVELQLTNSIFFNNNFSGVSSQTSGILVPGPSSLALLGLGGLIAARRRRA